MFVTTCCDIVSLSLTTMSLLDPHEDPGGKTQFSLCWQEAQRAAGGRASPKLSSRKGQGLEWNPQRGDPRRGEKQISTHAAQVQEILCHILLFLDSPNNMYLFYYVHTIWLRRAAASLPSATLWPSTQHGQAFTSTRGQPPSWSSLPLLLPASPSNLRKEVPLSSWFADENEVQRGPIVCPLSLSK